MTYFLKVWARILRGHSIFRFFFGLILNLLAVSALAIPINEIKIVGQKKIEASAVQGRLISKVKDEYSASRVREDVKALFATGFFNNVEVIREKVGTGYVLTYRVQEKPKVSAIIFEGNEEVSDNDINEVVGIKAFEILDMSKVRQAQEKIEKLYEEKGHFLARVQYRVEPDGSDSEKLIFKIQENEQVKVSKIRFLGNNRISEDKLKNVMQTKEGGFFSFISGSGSFKQEVFERDIQALYYLVYYNEGYIQAQIDRPQVYVTPDKKRIHITIKVDEGEQYNVGEVNFAGDLLFTDTELNETVKIKRDSLFKYTVMQNDLSQLTAKYGDLGYAYANVIPRTRIRERERLVDITFEVDKGNKVYIRKITAKGNTRTRDKVLRREMLIHEGELYNETKRRESLANIKRLGFFEEVNFNTRTPPGRPDLMDIDIVVKERNTGQINLGAGYSTFSRFIINGQIQQANLGGRGQRLGLSIDYSQVQSIVSANFTEPFFNDTNWSVGGEAYYRSRDNEQTDFKEERVGTLLRVGHPIAPYLEGAMAYKIDDTNLRANDAGAFNQETIDSANGLTSALVLSMIYDKRDDRMMPADGIFNSYSLEYAGLGGDLKYTKGLINFRYYQKVFWDVVWRNNLSYGIVTENSSRNVPFNQLFLLGGANTLRGFDFFSVGKRRQVDNTCVPFSGGGTDDCLRPFGGKQQLFYNLEFQFPLINEAGIMGVVFYDIGAAEDTFQMSDFRSNVGFGFRWFSPLGPLRFEWGLPFDRDEQRGERAVNFEFAIGAPF